MINNNEKSSKTKYIKLWLFLITLFSCIMICIQIYISQTNDYILKENIIDYKILSSLTPKYPKPLFNFTD